MDKVINSSILDKAIKFATDAHSGMVRKGGISPYILHPLEAGAIAGTMTDDLEVIAAAVLHDVVEDTPITIEQIISEFGERIGKLVASESEDKMEHLPKDLSWKTRKQATISHLEHASKEEQILVLADKLSNIRSFYRDYSKNGESFWQRFNMKDKSQHEWYYKQIAEKLTLVKDSFAYKEYVDLVSKVFD